MLGDLKKALQAEVPYDLDLTGSPVGDYELTGKTVYAHHFNPTWFLELAKSKPDFKQFTVIARSEFVMKPAFLEVVENMTLPGIVTKTLKGEDWTVDFVGIAGEKSMVLFAKDHDYVIVHLVGDALGGGGGT